MGVQIGLEYALGGHHVTLVARNAAAVRERLRAALEVAQELGEPTQEAEARIVVSGDSRGVFDLAVESLPEDLELKAALLRPVAEESPDAVLASNTSSLSIAALGEAIGAPARTIGTHYWNPPLLMPLVELTPGERTAPEVVTLVRDALVALGKRPVLVEREVPGFIWNRLQAALLRECLWLVEEGVATPDTVDEVIRSGLARRYRHVGLFDVIALGGVETWSRAMGNLLPTLSDASDVGDLARVIGNTRDAEAIRLRRDSALVEELIRERRDDGER
jgi:3-hydroxybutyryl-CoA dehydrogenase